MRKVERDEPLEQGIQIIETTVFTKQIDKLMDDDERQLLMDELILHPAAGDKIKGSGGLRKLRWSGSGRGKRRYEDHILLESRPCDVSAIGVSEKQKG